VANVIAFGLVAVNAWAAPLISDLHTRGDHAALQRMVRLAARGIFAFTLPVSLVVVVGGTWILALFGHEFVRAYTALVILTASQVVNALVGPVGFLMTMTGRQNLAAKILALHAVMMIVLNLLLIPRMGIEGAAVATGFTRVSWNVVMALAVWRTMRVRATIL
jgi:O-antigen/teichoic acid export membrane protein